jgi:hypothetical protein
MNLRKLLLLALVAASTLAAGGCWNDDDDDAAPAGPGEASYNVTVTGADVVNVDSGAEVPVGGMPLAGGALSVE